MGLGNRVQCQSRVLEGYVWKHVLNCSVLI